MSPWDNNQTTGTRAWIFQYRNDSRPGDGLVQLQMTSAPHQDPLAYPNDSADVIRRAQSRTARSIGSKRSLEKVRRQPTGSGFGAGPRYCRRPRGR